MDRPMPGRPDPAACFPQIFDSYPDAALVVRLIEQDGQPVDYQYVYINAQAAKMFDQPISALTGRSYSDVFHQPAPHLAPLFKAVRDDMPGQRWIYRAEICDFTSFNYSKVGDDLCLITGHFLDRSLLDAQQTLAASMSAFDMIISVNLTQNAYHMINYDAFHNRTAADHGVFDTLIEVGAGTLPPEWRDPFRETFGRAQQLAAFARGARVLSLDHQQYAEDGSVHWVRSQAILIPSEYTRDVMQVTTAQVIDDQKLVEQQLLQEQQAIYDSLPGGILRVRVEGDLPLLNWNQTFAALTGLDSSRPSDCLQLIHPQDREAVRQSIFAQAGMAAPVELSCRMAAADNALRWMHLIGCPLPAEADEAEYLFLAFDITQRRMQDEALKAERERYKTLYDTAPCAIVEYIERPDGSLCPNSCNPEARRMMGCSDAPTDDLRCKKRIWQVEDITFTQADADAYRAQSAKLQKPGDVVRFESRRRSCFANQLQDVYGTLELLEILPDGSRRLRNMYFDINEKRRQEEAQAALALKNETLRIALDNASLSYVYYYPAERRLQLGETAHHLLGLPRGYESGIDDLLDMLFDPEQQQTALKAYARTAAGEDHVQIDCRLKTSGIWCRARMSIARRDADGKPLLIICFLSDVTRERIHSVELQETLHAIAASFDFIYRMHVPTQTVTALRQSPLFDETIGRHNHVYHCMQYAPVAVPPEWKSTYLDFLDPVRITQCLRPDHVIETKEFPFVQPDGSLRWMRNDIILSAMEDGKVLSYLIALHDISQEKAHEARAIRLLRERNELNDAISAMFFSAFLLDLEQAHYRTLKRATSCSAAYPDDGSIAQLLEAHLPFLSPEDGEKAAQLLDIDGLRRTLSVEHPVVALELPIHTSQAELWLRLSVVLTQRFNNQPVHAVLIMQDVTAERAIDQQKQEALRIAFLSAQQANEAKSTFLSRMSHDIRTPLSAVIGMTSIAQAHTDEPRRVRGCLDKIDRSSRYLLSLINEVLDMSCIESGQVRLAEKAFSVSDLIDDLITIVQPQAAERGQRLYLQVQDLLHDEVLGDPQRLQQLCLNFLSNAIKYTPPGGEITLTLTEKPSAQAGHSCYEFVFADTGYGMHEDFLPHLFEPFSREEDSRTSKIQGTGLGMAISSSIVQMMGGSISVWSRPNEGSRFTATIYLKTQQTLVQDADLIGRRVLVVSGCARQRRILCRMLAHSGLRVQSAANLHDLPAPANWELMLLDRASLGADWRTAYDAMRFQQNTHMPVLLLCDRDRLEIASSTRPQDVSALLFKPVLRTRLLLCLSDLFRRSAAAAPPTQPLDRLAQSDFSDRRFLLVDDNALNLEIALELLSVTGAHLASAVNGREAVDLVAASPEGYFDLILMDIQMPVMDGYAAARAIRALDRSDVKHLPIFAMTANAFAEDVARSRQAGMDEHVAKPLDLSALHALLEKWLR